MSNMYNNYDNYNDAFEDYEDYECYPSYSNYECNASNDYVKHNKCNNSNSNTSNDSCRHEVQTHVHEYNGSTKSGCVDCSNIHNHRFAGVTGEAIPYRNSHVHKLETNTDFYNHYHEICDTTGPAIYVGNGKHVHFVKGRTSRDNDHTHEYIFATLIEAPTFFQNKK